jgi:hypothetical protein
MPAIVLPVGSMLPAAMKARLAPAPTAAGCGPHSEPASRSADLDRAHDQLMPTAGTAW